MFIERATSSDFPEICQVWWESVQRTHHFIDRQYLIELKVNFASYLEQVHLYCWRERNKIIGFIGISNDTVEMLFVHPDHMNRGIGRELLQMAISQYNISKVDVNEQNANARAFYLKNGFIQVGKSDLDSQGRPYPIIHLQRG